MKWNLHKQDEVSHYMSDRVHKVKADIEKKSWKIFFGLVRMTFGLVHVGYSLPEGQVVKLIFFAPWPKSSSILRHDKQTRLQYSFTKKLLQSEISWSPLVKMHHP